MSNTKKIKTKDKKSPLKNSKVIVSEVVRDSIEEELDENIDDFEVTEINNLLGDRKKRKIPKGGIDYIAELEHEDDFDFDE